MSYRLMIWRALGEMARDRVFKRFMRRTQDTHWRGCHAECLCKVLDAHMMALTGAA